MEVKFKYCKLCDTKRPIWCFYRDKRSSDGHVAYCSECTKERRKPTDLDILRKTVDPVNFF